MDRLKSVSQQSLPVDHSLCPSSSDTPGSGSDTDQSLVGKQRCSWGLPQAAHQYLPEALPSSESPGVHSVHQGLVRFPYHQVPAWFGCVPPWSGCVLDEAPLASSQAHPTNRALACECLQLQWTEAIFWIFPWELVQSPHRLEGSRNHCWSPSQWRHCWRNYQVQWRWDPVAFLCFYSSSSHQHLLVSERSWSNQWCSSADLGLQKEEEHEWSQQKQVQSALLLTELTRRPEVVWGASYFHGVPHRCMSSLQVNCPASYSFSGSLQKSTEQHSSLCTVHIIWALSRYTWHLH